MPKRIKKNWFELKWLWRINLKKYIYICYELTVPPWTRPFEGHFYGKNTSNLIDNYLFLVISQIWQRWCLINLLPPQYVVLPPTDHKCAGKRHFLKDHPQYFNLHLNYLYHYLDMWNMYILLYALFSLEINFDPGFIIFYQY